MGEGEAVGWCTGLNGVGEAAARRWPCAATAWSKDGGGEEVGPGGPVGMLGWLEGSGLTYGLENKTKKENSFEIDFQL
jgi:hypothetical protein